MADESDDDFVSYGTALEPIEDDAVRRKPVSLEDQVVTDKQGRRRFHGAFTGGFSAGYFNSVGSKEGWKPATFLSSRSQKTGGQSRQRAEDFMDDEDLGDFGIAPRRVVTTDKFAGEEKGRKRSQEPVRPSVIPGESPLQDLIVPTEDSMGARLLRVMGWRHGQGVGPKVRRRRRKKKSALNEADSEAAKSGSESDGADFFTDFHFAPADVDDMALKSKSDRHGLGYRGLDPALAGMGRHVSLFAEPTPSIPRSKRGMTGQAFGVGAFENADDDIYGMENMSSYDRVLGGEEPEAGNYGWTAPKPRSGKGGGGMLDDFKPSSQRRPANKVYPPPVLPRDFRPIHVAGALLSSSPAKENLPPTAGTTFKSSRFLLSASQRGAMLGEEPLPGPSSVFDFLSPDDRRRLKANSVSGTSEDKKADAKVGSRGRFDQAPPGATPCATSSATPGAMPSAMPGATPGAMPGATPGAMPGATPSATPIVTPTATPTPNCSQGAPPMGGDSGSGYQPFIRDPDKQQRYQAYLARKKNGGHSLSSEAPSDGLTEWERQREVEEFARAASLYRPLSSLMASRFVTAKRRDDEEKVEVPAEEGGDKSTQAKAAEMKMFGKLTRDSLEWHPDPLLCKRFNIPNPYPGSSIVGLPTVKRDKFSVFNFLTLGAPPSAEPAATARAPPVSQNPGGSEQGALVGGSGASGDKSSRWDKKPSVLLLADVGTSDSTKGSLVAGDGLVPAAGAQTSTEADKDQDETEEASRPPMDLFRAIFLSSSSSEDEEEEEEDEEEDKKKKEDAAKPDRDQSLKDSQHHNHAESGTADRALLCPMSADASHRVSEVGPTPASSSSSGSESKEAEEKEKEEEEAFYGPRLPPPSTTTPMVTSSGVQSRRKGSAEESRRSGDSRGGRRRSGDRKKEKRRKKETKKKKKKKSESRHSSHHKHQKEKKHKSKTRKRSKKAKEGSGGGQRSSGKRERHGRPRTPSEVDYDASGSSSSNSSDSSSDDSR